jgi:uncharacterized glyoxalase superfamily protein PhnB
MNKLTPNLIVESIEDSLGFWVDRLGFTKTVEVPEGDKIGFVILTNGKTELMLQSLASLRKDVPPLAAGPHHAVVYIEVDDLAAVRGRLADWPHVVPERKTPYGAREIIVKDPAGHAVFIAEHVG